MTTTTGAVCGDGTQEGDEACDNGEGNGPGKECSSECTLNTCGNNMLDKDNDEECDNGDNNADDATCTSECKEANCGDGLLLAGENPEECDNGEMNGVGQDCLEDCTLNLCGNGLDDGEECDDGNRVDDDGCSSICTIEHRLVFVTSIPFPGNLTPAIGDLSGLPLADAHCQQFASDAKKSGTFMAWLSDGDDGPSTRFGLAGPGFTGVFELATGTPIAEGWADLTDGVLAAAIDVTENGQAMQSSTVWTNTNIDGTPTGDQHCDGWTSEDANGGAGKCKQATTEWTEAITENACLNSARLYCFQVSSKNP